MAATAVPPAQTRQRTIQFNTVRIVSIFPQKTTIKQLACAKGFERFQIQAAERGSYQVIEVSDTYQWIRDLRGMGEGGKLTPGMEAVFTPALARAESLIIEWTHNTLAAFGKPGIAIVPDHVEIPGPGQSPNDPGFEEFNALLSSLVEVQQTCFQSLITDANDRYHRGDAKNIQDIHRKAADWMYGEAAKSLPWFRKDTFNQMKKCIGCAMEIKKEALRCQHCSLDLIDYYTKYSLDASGDPVLAATIAKINEKAPVTPDTMLRELEKPKFELPRIGENGEPLLSRFSKTEKDWALSMATKKGGTYQKYLKQLAEEEKASTDNAMEAVTAAAEAAIATE